MSLFVKICGMTCREGLQAAVEEGADAVGFVFHAPSPRHLSPQQAQELAAPVPRHVKRVAVMLRPQQADWDEVFDSFKPDCLQADADCLAKLQLAQDIGRLPVYRDHERFNAKQISPETTCLFEGAASGMGRSPDWERAALVARRARVLLAGGLHPGNVDEAIRRVGPWGVDVSSGVESAAGVKDPNRVRAFIRVARKADRRP